jgi:hypothetical protein
MPGRFPTALSPPFRRLEGLRVRNATYRAVVAQSDEEATEQTASRDL